MFEIVLSAALASNQAFEADVLPKVQEKIGAACGVTLPVGVNWSDFGDDTGGADTLVRSELSFLTAAFAEVCKDAALKSEVDRQVKKIVLRQAYGATEPILYISKGTLYIEYLWVANEPPPDAAYVGSELVGRLRGEELEAP